MGRNGVASARSIRARLREIDPPQFLLFLLLIGLLSVFILYPIFEVVYVAFTQDGSPTLAHFFNFFERQLFREALWNSLFAGVMAVAIGSLLGLPLALITVKYDFPGRTLAQTLGVLPLVMPPFVGAVAMQLVLGRSGAVNPAMQQVHPSYEEAVMNLGTGRRRTFVKVALPLMIGGMVAGGVISFITSSVELSSTMMLVPKNEHGPLSFGIYVYMQSAVGRGPGACLGVVAILLVAAGTYLVNRVFSDGSGTPFKL